MFTADILLLILNNDENVPRATGLKILILFKIIVNNGIQGRKYYTFVQLLLRSRPVCDCILTCVFIHQHAIHELSCASVAFQCFGKGEYRTLFIHIGAPIFFMEGGSLQVPLKPAGQAHTHQLFFITYNQLLVPPIHLTPLHITQVQ